MSSKLRYRFSLNMSDQFSLSAANRVADSMSRMCAGRCSVMEERVPNSRAKARRGFLSGFILST